MTDTQVPPFRRHVALFNASMVRNVTPTVFRKDNGNLVVQGQPVFRSGKFRDSTGMQATWESLHMDQMVAHFDMLRNRGLLTDIPVRDGHPGFLVRGMAGSGKVVGWHTGLSTKEMETQGGTKETFLLADYEFTDPEAATMYENGTYRNRSSEVGEYTTNDEATFWPTYMGFAWVDIPAVEGLNTSFSAFSTSRQLGTLILPVEKGSSVGTEPGNNGPGQGGAPGTQPHVPVPQIVAFSINGQSITDPGVVQTHITTLEVFQRETFEARRVDFVNSLAKDGKILATAIDGNIAFAKSLTPAQFETWKTTMEGAPASSVLSQHGGTGTQTPPAVPGEEAKALRIGTLSSVVTMHQAAGLSPEAIRNNASYKELILLDPTAAI